MITTNLFDNGDRVRSYELVAEVAGSGPLVADRSASQGG